MIRLEVKDGEFNLADYIYDDSNNQHPKYHSAALVKWRNIPLRRGFDDSVAILRHDDCVGFGGILNFEF